MELVRDDYKYTNISTATTTQVNIGPTRLIRIVLNEVTAGAITVRDAITDTTPIVATIATTTPSNTLYYGVRLTAGLRITTAGADDCTIVWTPN